MSLRNKDGYWHYRFMVDGQRIEKSTGLAATKRNEQPALDIEAARRLELIRERAGIGTPKVKTIGFTDAIMEWLAYSAATSVPGTHNTRKVMSTSAKLFFGNQPVKSIDTGAIEKYITWRLTGEEEIAPVCKTTARNNANHLSTFFQWAVKHHYISGNPVLEADIPVSESQREYVVSPEEERVYFSYATGSLYDLGRLMILQGCRPNEILKLRRGDVDLSRGKMIVGSKTEAGMNRELKLTPESLAILSMRMSRYSNWLFPGEKREGHSCRLDQAHRRLLIRTGMSWFVLYDFRHTFATRMIEAGIDIVALKDILGHSNIKMTLRYVHLAQEHKDKAMDKYMESLRRNECLVRPV